MYHLWLIKAYVFGAFLLLFLNLFGKKHKVLIGTGLPNGQGDVEKADLLKAEFYRVPLTQALRLNPLSLPHEYCLLMENVDDEGNKIKGPISKNDNENDKMRDIILKWYKELPVKPKFIMCQNEQNEISHYLANSIRQNIDYSKVSCPIVKGPHSNVVESAARKKYYQYLRGHKAMNYRKEFPHVFNFYLKPLWLKKYRFENLLRKSMFTYIVVKMRYMGYSNFYITEAHDGGKTRPGYSHVHGDYVYQSKKGWDSIIHLCSLLKIKAVMQYHAPFLTEVGNTVLSGEKDT